MITTPVFMIFKLSGKKVDHWLCCQLKPLTVDGERSTVNGFFPYISAEGANDSTLYDGPEPQR